MDGGIERWRHWSKMIVLEFVWADTKVQEPERGWHDSRHRGCCKHSFIAHKPFSPACSTSQNGARSHRPSRGSHGSRISSKARTVYFESNLLTQTPILGYQSPRYHCDARFVFSQFSALISNAQIPNLISNISIPLHAKSLKKSQRGTKQGGMMLLWRNFLFWEFTKPSWNTFLFWNMSEISWTSLFNAAKFVVSVGYKIRYGP